MKTETHFLFYSTSKPVDDIILLDVSESHHAQHVLRIQELDPVMITDGSGTVYGCVCGGFRNSKLIAIVKETETVQRSLVLHLFVALPERDAFESILTECTALGVEQITPIIAAHCQRPWWKQSWEKHLERFHNIMIVSMKQSLFPFLPKLNKPLPLSESFTHLHDTLLVADLAGEYPGKLHAHVNLTTASMYVGPPGGFTDLELCSILEHGAHKVKISESRLRTELACIALCAQLRAFQ